MRSRHAVLLIVGFVVALSACDEAQRDAEGAVTQEGSWSAFEVRVGDCFMEPSAEEFMAVRAVPCSQPHDAEVFHLARFPGAYGLEPFPGDSAFGAIADRACEAAFAAYVGVSYAESDLYMSYHVPTPASWADGDRQIVCALSSESGQLQGSMRGSRR